MATPAGPAPVAAYREALEVFRAAGATHYVGVAEENLGRAQAEIEARKQR
ncbi:MAG: hypothetical protein ACT4P2_12420 [Pseudomonadota bacterium]